MIRFHVVNGSAFCATRKLQARRRAVLKRLPPPQHPVPLPSPRVAIAIGWANRKQPPQPNEVPIWTILWLKCRALHLLPPVRHHQQLQPRHLLLLPLLQRLVVPRLRQWLTSGVLIRPWQKKRTLRRAGIKVKPLLFCLVCFVSLCNFIVLLWPVQFFFNWFQY